MESPGMARIITVAAAHPRPIQVERSPGCPPVVRYSTSTDPGTVLRGAMANLDNDEVIALAEALGLCGHA
jgi:hypothetical protein